MTRVHREGIAVEVVCRDSSDGTALTTINLYGLQGQALKKLGTYARKITLPEALQVVSVDMRLSEANQGERK